MSFDLILTHVQGQLTREQGEVTGRDTSLVNSVINGVDLSLNPNLRIYENEE